MIEVIGIIGTVLVTGAMFPQLYKTLYTGDVNQFSWAWIIMFTVGLGLLFILSVAERSSIFITINFAISTFQGIILSFTKIYFTYFSEFEDKKTSSDSIEEGGVINPPTSATSRHIPKKEKISPPIPPENELGRKY